MATKQIARNKTVRISYALAERLSLNVSELFERHHDDARDCRAMGSEEGERDSERAAKQVGRDYDSLAKQIEKVARNG